eukprot:691338-Heterocapsa_arctica.AAC.1
MTSFGKLRRKCWMSSGHQRATVAHFTPSLSLTPAVSSYCVTECSHASHWSMNETVRSQRGARSPASMAAQRAML